VYTRARKGTINIMTPANFLIQSNLALEMEAPRERGEKRKKEKELAEKMGDDEHNATPALEALKCSAAPR